MDPRKTPQGRAALGQAAANASPADRAQIIAYLNGGMLPTSATAISVMNTALQTQRLPPLPTTPGAQIPASQAAAAGTSYGTPAAPTPVQPRAPMLPVSTNTTSALPPGDGPGANGVVPGYVPPGGGQVSDGPGAGGGSSVYTPPTPLAAALGDGSGASSVLDAPPAPPGYVPQPPRPGTAAPYVPGPGGSLGTSTTPLAPPVAGGGSTTVTPPQGGTATGRELALRNDKNGQATFLDSLLQGLGVDLNHPGMFGGGIANNLKDVIPNLYALIGLQGGVRGNVDTLYQDTLGKLINSGQGGSLFSTLQGLGQGARQTVLGAGAAGIVDPNQQQDLLQATADLGSYGNNPYLRQGSMNLLGNAFRDFGRVSLATQGGANQPKDYIDWIRQQTDPQYRAVLRLLGVGQ